MPKQPRNIEEINRQKQQQQIDEQHQQEATARPDAIHRAVHFLLDQVILNNRDCRREADYHKRSLDEKLGDIEKIREIEGIEEPNAVELAEDLDEHGAPPAAPLPAPNPARTIKVSRRFRKQ